MIQDKKIQKILLWADRIGRGLISAVFIVAAVPKLFNVRQFAATIDAFAIVPEALLLPLAVVLPVFELILALGLLFDRFKCKVGITALLLFFIGLLVYSIGLGLDIDCGCFGPEDPEYKAFHGLRHALVRDIVLLVPLIYSFWYHGYRNRFSTSRRTGL